MKPQRRNSSVKSRCTSSHAIRTSKQTQSRNTDRRPQFSTHRAATRRQNGPQRIPGHMSRPSPVEGPSGGTAIAPEATRVSNVPPGATRDAAPSAQVEILSLHRAMDRCDRILAQLVHSIGASTCDTPCARVQAQSDSSHEMLLATQKHEQIEKPQRTMHLLFCFHTLCARIPLGSSRCNY